MSLLLSKDSHTHIVVTRVFFLMPAKCLTFLFIRLTDSEQEIKAECLYFREKDTEMKRENGRATDTGSRRGK